MNNHEQIIDEVAKRLKRSDYIYQIKTYLKGLGLNDEEMTAYIKKGQERLTEQKIATQPLRNKIIFGGSLLGLIVIIFLFTSTFPSFGSLNTTFPSLIGAILFFAFMVLCVIFFNSWKEENIRARAEKKHGLDPMTAAGIALVPTIILFFIFSSQFKRGADDLLRDTMVNTTGIVLDGFSSWSNSGSNAEVTVRFETREGQQITVTEKVSTSDFDHLYQYQEIPVIYSHLNPMHYKLLIDEETIETFMGISNQPIEPVDLISFFDIPMDDMENALNTISFGWAPTEGEINGWTNSVGLEFIKFNNNHIEFATPELISETWPRKLEKLGFKRTDNQQGGDLNSFNSEKIYETKEHRVILSTMFNFDAIDDIGAYSFASITKR